MKGYLYILFSEKDKRTYTGSTNDLSRRINDHNAGRVKATKDRRPVKIIHSETFKTLTEARLREKYYKTGAGRRKLKEIFESLKNKPGW